jgi:phenylacetaldehyde dehydrogenase
VLAAALKIVSRGAAGARLCCSGRGQCGGQAGEEGIEAALKFSGAIVGGQDRGEAAQQGEFADRQPVQAQPQQVEGAANAIFFNHGQCCVAGSRLFVQRGRFDEVVDGVAEIAKSIKMGPGMEPGTQMGPLVSDEQFRRVTGYLDSGKSDGATALAGGGRFGDRGYFVEPTVLTNTRPDMKVVREEIFGPVLVASPFTDLDEIAGVANDSEYGLGAGIWTRDISKAHALAKKLRAGTVWINCYNVFDAALPFGGYKQSGWGREMGHEVLNNYTEVKAVTTQL